nr:hypothetical protein [Tanacetum cinerariifolium]
MTYPHSTRNVVPTVVLTRSRLVSLNAARLVSTAVPQTTVKSLRPVKHVVNKAHSPIRRPINHRQATKNSNFNKKVTTVKVNKVNVIQGNKGNAEKASANWIQVSHGLGPQKTLSFLFDVQGNPQQARKDKGDSGCSRHMTGNISFLSDFEEINRGYVAFGGNPKGGKITGKGKIKTRKLYFDNVYFVKELKFNLFSVSQMCDKKNNVLFTDTECVVLSSNYKLPDKNHILLRVPRENNMYNVDLKNVVPLRDLTCLFSKATLDESNLWHRRLGHINFKTMNKFVKGNLVRGLPSKIFKNNHTCVACKKGKQYKASCKSKPVSFVSYTLQRMKGIKREFSVARTPQQNEVVERKNITLIEAARIMLADLLLHIPFWAEADNTACYVQNRVLGTKPHNKTPYELLLWNQPNDNAGIKENIVACKVRKETVYAQKYVLLPLWSTGSQDPHNTDDDAAFDVKENENDVHVSPGRSDKSDSKKHDEKAKIDDKGKNPSKYLDDPDMPELEDIVYSDDKEDVGAEADFSNLETNISVSPIQTTRVHKDHPVTQIISDLTLAPQTRSMTRMVKEQEPNKVHQALKDLCWIEAMQEELLQFKMQKVWVLVDLPKGKRAIGIDYNEVFTPVARIKAIQLFLAYASFMGFMVYQMDVKSDFLYGTIKEEVYVCQPPGFEDPDYPDKVYKVVKALYGLHQALRPWFEILANYLLENGFQRGKIDQTLFINKKKRDILLVQVYVDDIIFGSTNKELCNAFKRLMKDKFQMSSMGELTFFLGLQVKKDVKSASTPIETKKPLLKDPNGKDVDVHIYRHFLTAVSYKLMLFGLTKVVAVNLTLLDGKKLVVTEDVIRQDLHLGNADGIECLPNEEIFAELACMGYENPPPKLTFYKALFSAQCKFLIHTLVQCVSAKRNAWNEFSCSMASAVTCLATGRKFNFSKYIFNNMVRNVDNPSKFLMYPRVLQVIINNQVDDLTSHNTKYTSPALTQKVFANMHRVRKEFSGVETPFFASMMVQHQPQAAEVEEEVEVPTAPVPPSPTNAPSLQDKHTQELEILKLKKRVKKLEKKRRSKYSGLKRLRKVGGKIKAIDADKDITLVDVETQVDMDAELQGRIHQDVNAATKDVSTAEPTMFDDEEVTMTMAQTLIKMKAENARLLDEQISKRLHDEEIEKAIARDKQEKDYLERAQVLQNLKRKPVSIAKAKKNMIIYLKNTAGYKWNISKVKYPIIDWEIHYEGSRSYWKIIRVGEITEAYQSFEDMLKGFDREDLVALWRLVKEKFSVAVPNVNKEKALCVELKRLFEPDVDDVLWKLQKYMHYPITWKLHTNCGVHQVSSTTRRHDMFMLIEKDYPLSNGVMTLMLSAKLQVEEDNEMARYLVMKIFIEANKPKSRSLDTSSK